MSHLVPIDQIERMAVAVAKSGLFGVKQPEQAIALMLIAQAEGLHPAIAARDYNIIQGRPALKSDAMLARFQQAGGKVAWGTYTDQAVSATFSHPQGGSVVIEWTIAQAKAAGLTSKDNWRQYPRAMLRARVISEGIRTVFPGVVVGAYTPEEIEDFDAKPEQRSEASPAPKLEPKEVANVIVESPAPTKVAIEDPKKALFAAIKKSGWTSDQLRDYCATAYKQESARALSVDQLSELVETCTKKPYSQAADELMAAAKNPMDSEDNAL